MEGQFVEIGGVKDGKADEGTVALTTDLNGKKARVVRVDEESGMRTVQTLDNSTIFTVPEDNLTVVEAGDFAESGFDAAWPFQDAEYPQFAAKVTECLMQKDYCVVQMCLDEQTQINLSQQVDRVLFKPMKRDFQAAYLGRDHRAKSGWMEELADDKEDLDAGLDTVDEALSILSRFIVPLAPTALGFNAYSRTNGLVRMPFENAAQEDDYMGNELDDDDIEDGLVDQHIMFCRRRQLCMIYTVETDGGSFTLFPKDTNKDEIKLPITKGRLVVFRHNVMSYSYQPNSTNDIAVQAWLLAEPLTISKGDLQGESANCDEVLGLISGPSTPTGRRTNVTGLYCALPGGADNGEFQWWAELTAGTDGQIDVPRSRFEMDPYYAVDEKWSFGYSYTHHGGFVQGSIYEIDRKFFGLTEDEAYLIAPAMKTGLEVSYLAFHNAGHTRKTLNGLKCGTFVGHSGDDWGGHPVWTMYNPNASIEEKGRCGYGSRIWSGITTRMAYTFGMKGPQTQCDTACSSSLIAYGIAHTSLRQRTDTQAPFCCSDTPVEALTLGVNLMPGPGGYTSLCGPHLLSQSGRCYTFDSSADGYERGEGTGAMIIKNEEGTPEERFACVIGCCLNQDGRSASMTAPNGPSQQDCIRGSMREAGVVANNVIAAECHGTGTALGDPIEVGALRGVMFDREVPLMETSAKAHIGHLEASAGQAGMQKCIMMCRGAAGSPNCHLSVLNPHLDVNGYPTIFCTELTDYGDNAGYSGVSSFGFGGANARGDVWARAQCGYRKTGKVDYDKIDFITVQCPIDDGDISYLDGRAVPNSFQNRFMKGPYHADGLRDEFDGYDYSSEAYKGDYILPTRELKDAQENPELGVFLLGSWNCYNGFEEMTDEENGLYTGLVVLGETRCEKFQIVLEENMQSIIYPCINNGRQQTRIFGPDPDGAGKYWLIDGRDDEVPVGTVYKVSFKWGDPHSVTWQAVDVEAPARKFNRVHTFGVTGTFTGWFSRRLNQVRGEGGENNYEMKVRLGASGSELFRIVRDEDVGQSIYPLEARSSTGGVCRGPDELWSQSKAFLIKGSAGELVTIRLQVEDAVFKVFVISPSRGISAWETAEGPARHQYFISGSINNWGMEEMLPDKDKPGRYTFQGKVQDQDGECTEASFRVVVDKDTNFVYYPVAEDLAPGEDRVLGPDDEGGDRVWRLTSIRPGASFTVVFDRNAYDRRKIVDVIWGEDRCDFDSMASYFAAGMGMAMGDY